MSREYTTKLSEEEINVTIGFISGVIENLFSKQIELGHEQIKCKIILEIVRKKLCMAKQKPYTNFQKIKDEMSLSDLVHISEDGVTYQDIQSLDKNIKVFQGEEKAKKWLESEVNENDKK